MALLCGNYGISAIILLVIVVVQIANANTTELQPTVRTLCTRDYDNAIIVGVQPFVQLLSDSINSSSDCERQCIQRYSQCQSALFIYNASSNHRQCQLYAANTKQNGVKLVPELPISDSDIIIVYQLFDECRQRKAQSQQSSSVGKDILSIIPAKGKRRQAARTYAEHTHAGEWSEWTSCTPGEMQVRTQDCNCEGRLVQRRVCQPVDTSIWGEWCAWSSCSCTCGIGVRTRSRKCVSGVCYGPSTESQACDAGPCERYGPWCEWSQCSCTCGIGHRTRRRDCLSAYCSAPLVESQPCDAGPCDRYGPWCEWSHCKGSCGIGQRIRSRICSGGDGRCTGPSQEVEKCDAGPCPQWSEWEQWGSCTVTCGSGGMSRRRTCLGSMYGGQLCEGSRFEERPCDLAPCSFWSQWQEWTGCSVQCGDGLKRRLRVCQHGIDCPGVDEENRYCFGPPCASWSIWTPFTSCSSSCGPGTKRRTRKCETFDGKQAADCLGSTVDEVLCDQGPCCHWGAWLAWGQCDADCGGGVSVRSRQCQSDSGMSQLMRGACNCEGHDRETKPCNTHQCRPLCAWSQWCAWTHCSVSCGDGVGRRWRTCHGEAGCDCPGPAEQSKSCQMQTCPQPRRQCDYSGSRCN